MAIRVDFNTGTSAVPAFSDITSYVRSVSISRGKDELLDGFSAGSVSIELDNRDRRFDPLFTSSPYNGDIVPRREVRVFSNYTVTTPTRTNLALNPKPTYLTSSQPNNWYTNLGLLEKPDLLVVDSVNYVYIANSARPYTSVYIDFTATAGQIHTISGQVTRFKDSPDYSFVVNVQFFTAAGLATGVPSTNTRLTNGLLTSSALAPNDAATGRVEFTTSPTFAGVTGPTVRELVIEVTSEVSTFYDGDTTDTADATYAWAGTPGSSVSTVDFSNAASGFAFYGYIDDWDLSYDIGGNNTASIRASDGFGLLANQLIADQTMPIESSGLRILRLLSDPSVNYPGLARNIQTGVKFLGTDVTLNDNALSYFQQIELSELGQLFVNKTGDLTFLDSSRNNPKLSDSTQTFADDGTGIAFTALDVVYGSEQLTNTLTVTYPAGVIVGTNTTSVDSYGVTSLSVETVNQNNTDAQYLANYYTLRFGSPQYRVNAITVNLLSLSDANQTAVLGLELGDVVTVKFTPGNVAPQIVQYGKVVRINSNIGDGGKRYEVEFGLETFQTFPFIFNDATYGKLDSTYVLGF
jgi:hypothetical protein